MKPSILVLALAVLAIIQQSAWSQSPEKPKPQGIPGYLDARTGAFKPVVQRPTEEEEAAAAAASVNPTTGKFVFNLTVSLVSSFPSTEVIVCGASANVSEANPFITIEEQAEVIATRSGSKATCTVTIPYSWPLVSPTMDMVGLSFSITASSNSVALARQSLRTLPAAKVPNSGSTTTMSLSATI